MNTDELRSAYLSAVGSHMEITETPSGYVVWAPLFYSDGDGVVLSVYPDAGGWLITDEGSTLSHLIDSGASVDGAVFTEAWNSLARPNEFIPASSTDAESIQTWTDDASLGEAIHERKASRMCVNPATTGVAFPQPSAAACDAPPGRCGQKPESDEGD